MSQNIDEEGLEPALPRRLTYDSSSSTSSPLRDYDDNSGSGVDRSEMRNNGLLSIINDNSRETPLRLRGSFNQLAMVSALQGVDTSVISTATSLPRNDDDEHNETRSSAASEANLEMDISSFADAVSQIEFIADETAMWAHAERKSLSHPQREFLSDVIQCSDSLLTHCVNEEMPPQELLDEVQNLLVNDERVFSGESADPDISSGCLDCAAALLMVISGVVRAGRVSEPSNLNSLGSFTFIEGVPVVQADAEADRLFQEALEDPGEVEGASASDDAAANVKTGKIVSFEDIAVPVGDGEGEGDSFRDDEIDHGHNEKEHGHLSRLPLHLHVEIPITTPDNLATPTKSCSSIMENDCIDVPPASAPARYKSKSVSRLRRTWNKKELAAATQAIGAMGVGGSVESEQALTALGQGHGHRPLHTSSVDDLVIDDSDNAWIPLGVSKKEKKEAEVVEVVETVEVAVKGMPSKSKSMSKSTPAPPITPSAHSPSPPSSPVSAHAQPSGPAKTHGQEPKKRLTLCDLDILKPISKGGFGAVFLARLMNENDGENAGEKKLVAVKMLSKNEMLRKNLVTNVLAERQILSHTENPFVVQFYSSFHTSNNLYLVMEYLPGGDLYSLLRVMGSLEEDVARYYIAETILALEYLHSRGIVHRDIKPDNILIGIDGHIRLTDFGLSLYGVESSTDVFTKQQRRSKSTKKNVDSSHSHARRRLSAVKSHAVLSPSKAGNRFTVDLGKDSFLYRDDYEEEDDYDANVSDGDDDGDGENVGQIDFGKTAPVGSFLHDEADERINAVTRTPTDPLISHARTQKHDIDIGRVPATTKAARSKRMFETLDPARGIGSGGRMQMQGSNSNDRDKGLRFLAGTPDYLAPEIVLGRDHSFAVDWWAVGIMLFEFLTGAPPFNGDSAATIFRAILQCKVEWPENAKSVFSAEVIDFVDQLLELDPKNRLGSHGDAVQVKRHPFFRGINWDDLQPPFVPEFESDADTTYFEPREELHPTDRASLLIPIDQDIIAERKKQNQLNRDCEKQ